jgi:peptidoglycan/LPS O-acetylase OafA/YrhL
MGGQAPTVGAPGRAGVPTPLHYVPALDGVRALAVLAVFALHANTRVRGGWIGVDIFFVLSGFLITALLLDEHTTTGRISLGAFYARRANRLLPALIAALAATGVIYAMRPGLDQGVGFGWSALAAMFYCANLVFVDLGILGHTWSLSLEEQFYAIWPLALFIGLRRKWPTRRLVGVALVGATAMAVVRALLWFESRDASGLNWRADGLLLGCALALLWRTELGRSSLERLVLPVVLPLGASAFLCVYAVIDAPEKNIGFYGGLVVANLAAGTVILHAVADARTVLTRFLALRPLVWLGRRSYGFYLFHPLVFAALGTMGLSFWPLIAARLVASAAVAGLSYRFVESYFLRRKPYPVRAPAMVTDSLAPDGAAPAPASAPVG